MKSKSALLERGREAYVNADDNLLQLLTGCDYVPVQRNRGIDAIVNFRESNSIALVRIQRKHEPLSKACDSLRKAASDKNASLPIVVRVGPSDSLLADNEIAEGVQIVDSTSFAIQSLLREAVAVS